MVAETFVGWRRTVRESVRVRATLVAVAVVGVALLAGAAGLLAGLHGLLVREVRAAATLQAAESVRLLDSGRDPVSVVAGDDDVFVQVLGPAGEVLRTTPNAGTGSAVASIEPGQWRQVAVAFDDDEFLAVSATASGGRTVLVGHSLDQVSASTAALAVLLAVGLPALLLLVGAMTWRVIGRTLAPVDAIRSEVDEISTSQLHRRVPQPPTDDEIGRLARTMNRMLDRLETANVRLRRFVADASHELRTPIATIREHAEVAIAYPEATRAGTLAPIVRDESLRMQALIDDLLLLTRADAQILLVRRRPVDVDDLVLAEARRLRELGTVSVDIHGVGAARVEGDPSALRRVLHNLGSNAARHAREAIHFELFTRDGRAELHVDDDGPGVAPEERAHVFERFVRLDDSRARVHGGSGLGLAIVAEIVAAHGGTAVIEDRPLGGARVTVRLPLSAG